MERSNTLEETCRGYSEYVCQNLSCHGGNWASKIRSGKLKALYLIILLGFQSYVFNYIITSLWTFWSGNLMKIEECFLNFFSKIMSLKPFSTGARHVSATYFKERSEFIPYPRITVCNPRMFDARKVHQMNISDDLLTYIRFTVDQDGASAFLQYSESFEEAPIEEFIRRNFSNTLDKLAIRYSSPN